MNCGPIVPCGDAQRLSMAVRSRTHRRGCRPCCASLLLTGLREKQVFEGSPIAAKMQCLLLVVTCYHQFYNSAHKS
eukprot:scaffold6051_cov28-Prasinocladus_malaysianus.AAC.1